MSALVASTGVRPVWAFSTTDGASGWTSAARDWLPAWLSWAKMRAPRSCTAAMTGRKASACSGVVMPDMPGV
jgi:hypothetical protein